jgi:hypothetical protein
VNLIAYPGTSSFRVYDDLPVLILHLTSVLVLLALPLKIVQFISMNLLGQLSVVYKRISVQPFTVLHQCGFAACKLLSSSASFDALADKASADGPQQISRELMTKRLSTAILNISSLNEHDANRLAHACYSESKGKSKDDDQTDVSQAAFEESISRNDLVDFKQMMPLFDRSRRGSLGEKIFMPSSLKKRLTEEPPDCGEIDVSDAADKVDVKTPAIGQSSKQSSTDLTWLMQSVTGLLEREVKLEGEVTGLRKRQSKLEEALKTLMGGLGGLVEQQRKDVQLELLNSSTAKTSASLPDVGLLRESLHKAEQDIQALALKAEGSWTELGTRVIRLEELASNSTRDTSATTPAELAALGNDSGQLSSNHRRTNPAPPPKFSPRASMGAEGNVDVMTPVVGQTRDAKGLYESAMVDVPSEESQLECN